RGLSQGCRPLGGLVEVERRLGIPGPAGGFPGARSRPHGCALSSRRGRIRGLPCPRHRFRHRRPPAAGARHASAEVARRGSTVAWARPLPALVPPVYRTAAGCLSRLSQATSSGVSETFSAPSESFSSLTVAGPKSEIGRAHV